MRSKLPLVLVAIVLAGLATLLVFQSMQGYKKSLDEKYAGMMKGMDPVRVVVAAADLTKSNMALTEEMVEVRTIPSRSLQPYAAQDPLDVVGRTPLGPLAKGQQILTNQLRVPGTFGRQLSTRIPPEKRALTVEMNPISGVGGFIRPGDHIDILWIVKMGGRSGQTAIFTLFQHVPVLAVGRRMMGQPAPADGKGGNEPTLTLAVGPLEAELLKFARESGQLQYTLRPKSDTEQVGLPPATMESLQSYAMPDMVQEAPPPAAKTVEIIRGANTESVSFTSTGP